MLPSDVLAVTQIHVALLQIPDRALTGRSGDRKGLENAGLADGNRAYNPIAEYRRNRDVRPILKRALCAQRLLTFKAWCRGG